jgi:hypothetical protein
MSEQTRAIIDYAEDGNATEMRSALYSAIQDKVMAHIENHKEQLAKTLFNQPQEVESETEAEVEDSEV